MLTHDRLIELLVYDPATGVFMNRVTRGRTAAGKVVGCSNNCGYTVIRLDDELYLAQRLAWMWVYGQWPSDDIDHINGVRNDNRIENLRPATRKQNLENQALHPRNTSGHRGVSWDRRRQKWVAYVTHNRKRVQIGRFAGVDEAALAAKVKRDDLFTHNKTEYAA